MFLVFAIAAGVCLVAAIGIGGRGGKSTSARVAHALERAADHMNGDAEPPRALVNLLR